MLIGASTFVLNSLLVKNLIGNLKKRSHLKSYSDVEVPLHLLGLTLAIPIKNESENLKRFLPLLERQHSLPEQIIFLVDESLDESAEFLRRFQTSFHKTHVKVVHQNNSCKLAAMKKLLGLVETEFVLFMDADVRLVHPRALYSLYEEAYPLKKGKFSFASVFPRSKAREDIGILVNQIFVQLYYLELTARSSGWGQIMMINAPKLREYKFLNQLTSNSNIGLKLAKLFKQKEKAITYFDGGALFQSEYYNSFTKAFRGISKKSFQKGDSPLVTLATSAIIFWCFVLPFILLPFAILNPWWFGALFVILWGQYRLMQELDLSPLFVLTTPIAATVSSLVQIWGLIQAQLEHKKLLVADFEMSQLQISP